MNKIIIATGLVLLVAVTKAQPPQPPKPLSIEERIKKTNEMLQQEVQPSSVQKTAIESAVKTFFNCRR